MNTMNQWTPFFFFFPEVGGFWCHLRWKACCTLSIACSFTLYFKNSITTQSEVSQGLNANIAECCMASVDGSLMFCLIAWWLVCTCGQCLITSAHLWRAKMNEWSSLVCKRKMQWMFINHFEWGGKCDNVHYSFFFSFIVAWLLPVPSFSSLVVPV